MRQIRRRVFALTAGVVVPMEAPFVVAFPLMYNSTALKEIHRQGCLHVGLSEVTARCAPTDKT